MILYFFGSKPVIFMADEKLIQDIYGRYNRSFTKNGRLRDWMHDLLGDSIIFSPSDDSWNERRKHLSTAFYKEKMIKMIDLAAKVAFDRVESWKKEYVGKDKDFLIFREPADLAMDCILACVFGTN